MTTGPVHWELLAKARAVDNQVFVLTCSPARNPDSSYQVRGAVGGTRRGVTLSSSIGGGGGAPGEVVVCRVCPAGYRSGQGQLQRHA